MYRGFIGIDIVTGSMKPIRNMNGIYEWYDGSWQTYSSDLQAEFERHNKYGDSFCKKIGTQYNLLNYSNIVFFNTLACYKVKDYDATIVRRVTYEGNLYGFDDDGDEYGRQIRLYPPDVCLNITIAREFNITTFQTVYGRRYVIDPIHNNQKNLSTGYVRSLFDFGSYHASPIIPYEWAHEYGDYADYYQRHLAVFSGDIEPVSDVNSGRLTQSRAMELLRSNNAPIMLGSGLSTVPGIRLCGDLITPSPEISINILFYRMCSMSW